MTASRHEDLALTEWRSGSLPSLSPTIAPFFFLTTTVVLVANSNQERLALATGNLRFAMYGLLAALCLQVKWRSMQLPVAVGFPFAALVALASSSVVWSPAPALTAQRAVGLALLLGSSWFVAQRCYRETRDVRRVFWAMTLAATLFLGAGLIYFLAGATESYEVASLTGLRRYMGLMVSPNSVGILAAVTLPVMVGLRREASDVGRLLLVAAALVALASLALSQSRGGVVAALIGLAGYALFDEQIHRGRSVALLLGLGVALSATFVILPDLQPDAVKQLGQRFQNQQPNSGAGSGRLSAWGLAVDIWEQRSIGGWGFGTADTVFGARAHEIEQVFQGRNPHNSYFNALLELGPLGAALLAFGALMVAATPLGGRGGALMAGLAGAIWAGIAVSMFESGLTSPGSLLGFSFWFSAFGLLRLKSLEESQRVSSRER